MFEKRSHSESHVEKSESFSIRFHTAISRRLPLPFLLVGLMGAAYQSDTRQKREGREVFIDWSLSKNCNNSKVEKSHIHTMMTGSESMFVSVLAV